MDDMKFEGTIIAFDETSILQVVLDKLNEIEVEENESVSITIDSESQIITVEKTKYERSH